MNMYNALVVVVAGKLSRLHCAQLLWFSDGHGVSKPCVSQNVSRNRLNGRGFQASSSYMLNYVFGDKNITESSLQKKIKHFTR